MLDFFVGLSNDDIHRKIIADIVKLESMNKALIALLKECDSNVLIPIMEDLDYNLVDVNNISLKIDLL